jgi:YHS domain-containing protein
MIIAPPPSRRLPRRLLCCGVGVLLLSAVLPALDSALPNDLPVAFVIHTGLVNAHDGIAIKGFDPVAYFTENRPVAGNPDISTAFDGAIWYFASEAHRRAFLAHPSRYEPEYGGFCAYGVAQGLKTDIDPAAFSIIGGRLYLNADQQARTTWRADLLNSIAAADQRWATVKLQQPA